MRPDWIEGRECYAFYTKSPDNIRSCVTIQGVGVSASMHFVNHDSEEVIWKKRFRSIEEGMEWVERKLPHLCRFVGVSL